MRGQLRGESSLERPPRRAEGHNAKARTQIPQGTAPGTHDGHMHRARRPGARGKGPLVLYCRCGGEQEATQKARERCGGGGEAGNEILNTLPCHVFVCLSLTHPTPLATGPLAQRRWAGAASSLTKTSPRMGGPLIH